MNVIRESSVYKNQTHTGGLEIVKTFLFSHYFIKKSFLQFTSFFVQKNLYNHAILHLYIKLAHTKTFKFYSAKNEYIIVD